MIAGTSLETLQAELESALRAGQTKAAIERLFELEHLDPRNANWPRRLGELYLHHQLEAEAVEAFARAAQIYSQSGELVRAIALSKRILVIDPKHAQTVRALAQLHSIPIVRGEPLPSSAPGGFGVDIASLPDEPLDIVPLNRFVRGTVPDENGMFEIPIVKSKGEAVDVDWSLSQDIASFGFKPATLDLSSEDIVEATQPSASESPSMKAMAAIPKTPFFSALSAESFHQIVCECTLVSLAPGEILFRQHDVGDALYVVAEGAVRVIDEGPPECQLAILEPGSFFGEIALVALAPRTATVQAASTATLIGIRRDMLTRAIARDPGVLTVLLKFLRDRLVERLMISHPLFVSLEPEARIPFARHCRFVEIETGVNLIVEGQRGTGLFILLTGRAEVTRLVNGHEVTIAHLKPGDLCGEISLITGQPAIASASAIQKCFAIELPARIFHRLIATQTAALGYVRDLAEQRRRELAAVLDGTRPYYEGRIMLV